jgi:hypothetical protein
MDITLEQACEIIEYKNRVIEKLVENWIEELELIQNQPISEISSFLDRHIDTLQGDLGCDLFIENERLVVLPKGSY